MAEIELLENHQSLYKKIKIKTDIEKNQLNVEDQKE